MSNLINVTCAIILKDNKVLVAQRSEKMKLPLKWEFPGGKLENNEDEASCVRREVREEINIEIEVIKNLSSTVHDYGDFKIRLIPFLANYVSGEIILLEHSDYRLLDKSELIKLDWAEADIPIVEEFLKIGL
ncbi:(deoxy)nucleoside triphosphate pyrophosphohydrolase [Flavobacterium sp. XN-5]|uniref:(deoxy)nucleoside triphosphate pyrophosphohydrolase n=1 Tax=Flavobacterium sp. XN-5 TaxID=2599390 RepID=UPI0011C7D8D6|nr:(deoxy)nucleoside triphosphate pyrophosphohydrolase [Flavobacterium sp. XN-5]NGY36640.1 (deoxy)nucleoside triphosphate pyrophosphohydrolase [Flavobacterium sp. XN-5]